MNDKLTTKRASLVESFNQIATEVQELENKKANLIANANAVKGAIMVIDELLAPAPDAEQNTQCPEQPATTSQ